MQGKDHLLLGTAVGVSTAICFMGGLNQNIVMADPTPIAFTVACMFGSLYPDIDLDSSTLGKKCFFSKWLNAKFGHRGFIHSPLNCVIMTCLLGLILHYCNLGIVSAYITLGFAMGFLVHIIQDTCTLGGIPWLFPLPYKFHLTRVRTKSYWCVVMTMALGMGWVALISRFGVEFLSICIQDIARLV